jgi:beta-lactam-binding protein with PASTA domain
MISLLVADPAPPQAFVMPNFIGQPLDTVKLIVQGSGLRVGTITEARIASPAVPAPSGSAPPPAFAPSPTSLIVTQNPGPGEKVLAGAAVNFEVR